MVSRGVDGPFAEDEPFPGPDWFSQPSGLYPPLPPHPFNASWGAPLYPPSAWQWPSVSLQQEVEAAVQRALAAGVPARQPVPAGVPGSPGEQASRSTLTVAPSTEQAASAEPSPVMGQPSASVAPSEEAALSRTTLLTVWRPLL